MQLYAWFCHDRNHVEVRLPGDSEPLHAELSVYRDFQHVADDVLPLRRHPTWNDAYLVPQLLKADQRRLEEKVNALLR